MKTIRLLRLVLSHFKGVASYVFAPDGHSAEVRGDNATGKTTLHDAWTWLLFGRDSAGRSDFSIKTIGLESADHTVEAEVEIDGTVVKLCRTYREKWTKKRGAAASEMTGHETEYQIDGVPLREKEWRQQIGDLVPEATWALVSSPTAFSALHWTERRKILLDLCGAVTDEAVIGSSPELADLPLILGRRKPDDHRKVLLATRKETNHRLTEIPARIDELTRTLAALDGLDRAALTARLAEVDALIADAKAGAGVDVLLRERSAAETQRIEMVGRRNSELSATLRVLRDRLSEERSKLDISNRRATAAEEQAEAQERQAKGHDDKAASLREAFARAAAPVADLPGICPVCNQALPTEQIEEARQQANLARAERLKAIREDGQRAVAAAQKCRAEATRLLDEAGRRRNDEAEATRSVVSLTADLAASESAQSTTNEPILALAQRVADLDAQIRQARAGAVDTAPLDAEARVIRGSIAKIDAAVDTEKRIAELAQEQRKLAGEVERMERELFLLDRFDVRRAEVIEGEANGRFTLARFALFDRQVNGGVTPCCTITDAAGVPYGSGLNRGSEVQVGLDVIRTLSKFYGLQAPIFCDNAESTVEIPDIGAQMIKLVVDGGCPRLTVKLED